MLSGCLLVSSKPELKEADTKERSPVIRNSLFKFFSPMKERRIGIKRTTIKQDSIVDTTSILSPNPMAYIGMVGANKINTGNMITVAKIILLDLPF